MTCPVYVRFFFRLLLPGILVILMTSTSTSHASMFTVLQPEPPAGDRPLSIWQTLAYVQLAWEGTPDPTGYHVYRSLTTGVWQQITRDPLPISQFVDLPPSGVAQIRYRVTWVDAQGNEHPYTATADISYQPPPPGVQSPTQFDRNSIMSDAEFLDSGAVTAAQIQAYLDSQGRYLRHYRLSDGRLASQAIVEESARHGINPIVLFTRLQVEQGLISKTDANPPTQHQLDYAFGYGCPDTGGCNPDYAGFARQLNLASETLRAYITEIDQNGQTRSGWAPGRTKQTSDPLAVTPANRATAALYTYTPWVGQGGGGRAGVGGNYLVWQVFYDYVRALGVQPADTTPPTGNLISPDDNSVTNNPAFTITADASDNAGGSGVNRVEFFAHHDGNWERICTATSLPYACTWNAPGLSDQDLTFTLHVYDHAGNQAVDPSGYRHVKLDRTLPTGSITAPPEGSATNNPAFTITADANDNPGGSGVNRVEFFAHHDGNEELICTATSLPYSCSWNAGNLSDQDLTFTLHVYDHAGNQAVDPGGQRHIKLDRTPPPIPTVTDSAGSTNGIWQNRLCQPNFVWDAVTDNLTGVAGYLIYWGTDPMGTSETLITETEFAPPACAGPVAISSLRMATRDTVGNTSAWHTVYTLRYDKSEPSGQFTLNHSWTAARSRAVPLDLTPEDTGSGVGAMRLGDTCTSLGDWQPFQPRLWWQLAGQHGTTASVCVEYRDGAGNKSASLERQLQLDFYPQRPASARYRVTADVVAMQGSVRTTDHYQVQSTMGQVLASGSYARSPTYQLALGYWAGMDPRTTSTPTPATPTATATNSVTPSAEGGTPTPTHTGTPTPTAIPGPGGDLYLPLVWR